MPDQDDFEPLGRQWRPVYDEACDKGTDIEIADRAMQVVTMMLRNCGGCVLLPELSYLLESYQQKLKGSNLWEPVTDESFHNLWTSFEQLAGQEANQRIHMVAIRSAQAVALQLQEGIFKPGASSILKTHLAQYIVKDLIAHCFLDAARAQSIGERFLDGGEAHQFYNDVMASLDDAAKRVGKQLLKRPDGKRLRSVSVIGKKYDTSSILHNDEFRLD